MDKKLWIDLDAVNGSIEILDDELSNLNASYERVKSITGELNDAWIGQKTEKIYSEISSFGEGIAKIKESINNIKNNVSQYKTNVENVDASVSLSSSAGVASGNGNSNVSIN